MKKKSWIELVQLTKHFRRHANEPLTILDCANAKFFQGETYSIKGVSGSGKSTLLFMLLGFDEPTDGFILYDNQNLVSFSCEQRRLFLQKYMGFVLQKPYLIKEFSVCENIIMKAYSGKVKKSDLEMAIQLLEAVGLGDKLNEPPATLSGGQQQRAAIARALFNKPTFLIADEPTAHLDSANKKQVIDLLINLCKKHEIGLIISTHDDEVISCMDNVFLLKSGKLEPEIKRSSVFTSRVVQGV